MDTYRFIKTIKQIWSDYKASSDFSMNAWRMGLCTNEELDKALQSINETFDEQIEELEMFDEIEDNKYQAQSYL